MCIAIDSCVGCCRSPIDLRSGRSSGDLQNVLSRRRRRGTVAVLHPYRRGTYTSDLTPISNMHIAEATDSHGSCATSGEQYLNGGELFLVEGMRMGRTPISTLSFVSLLRPFDFDEEVWLMCVSLRSRCDWFTAGRPLCSV